MADTLEHATDEDRDTLVARRADLFARLIAGRLGQAAGGHCVRVNHLERDEARRVCQLLVRQHASDRPTASTIRYALLASRDDASGDPLAMTADQAIEVRNRKDGALCLFVPADLVDAAASSLGNSFAEINGVPLTAEAQKLALAELGQSGTRVATDAVSRLGAVRRTLKPNDHVSGGSALDLTVSAAIRAERGTLDHLGLELWRVNLIADARPEFADFLTANRSAVRKLYRPTRAAASTSDRVASLAVDGETARALGRFFADRPVPDVAAWSRDLVATGLTFDTWVFPEQDTSDLRSVSVTSFTNAQGAVVTTSKLSQPDGPGTPLIAQVGSGAKLVVRWVSDPVKTPALHGWVAAIQPATDDAGADVAFLDLPSKQTKGTTRSATLSLNIDLDEPPDTGFRVRVVAVDASGNELTGADTGDPIAALSDEFYLVTAGGFEEGSTKTSIKKRSVTTVAEGRIGAVLETKEQAIALIEPMWSVADDLVTFTLRADPRQTMTLTFSPFLLELERRTLADPRSGGRWSLSVSEVLPAAVESCQPGPRIAGHSGVWSTFWDVRDRFFAAVRGNDTPAVGPPYPCVETFAWDDDAIARAVAYAESYERLLTTVHGDDLADALSIDTLCVASDAGRDPERSVVVLPTHPLRTLWSASHAALLRHWEGSLMEMAPAERKRAIDLQLLGRLRPTNMPAFARDWEDGSTHVFFRNLGGSHGVALPAGVPDPMRRFIDLARITGWDQDTAEPDDDGPRRLARHLERFRELHPYADPFRLALVNPDQGAYVAEALDTLLRPAIPADQTTTGDEDRTLTPVPMLDIAAYFDESQTRQGSLHGIERLRQRRGEWQTRHASDHLYPALSASIQSLSTLTAERPEDSPDAHVAMVTDLCQPEVHARPRGTGGPATSLALHGLIARFLSDVSIEGAGVRWDYRIATTTDGAVDHPAGGKLGTRMVTLQSALYDAWGRSLLPGSTVAVEPVLRVSLQERQIDLLETLHDNADWVLTIDRFFGVEYYDSPNIPAFQERAEKHLIDYSPEFIDGLGHRMIVTTAWREEVTTILRRALTELGFGAVDSSVRVLLRHLKSVSGRLALRALEANSGGASAVSLAAVMAWLEARGRLRDTLLVPIDVHQDIFNPTTSLANAPGQRRCDLVLVRPGRQQVEMTFVEVKWRHDTVGSLQTLTDDMAEQMRATGENVQRRFFDPARPDSPLQRSALAHVLRFYASRASRYGTVNPDTAREILDHISRYERSGLPLQPAYEGFVVSLADQPRHDIVSGDTRVRILTAHDFEDVPELRQTTDPVSPVAGDGRSTAIPIGHHGEVASPDPKHPPETGPDDMVASLDRAAPARRPGGEGNETAGSIEDTRPSCTRDHDDVASTALSPEESGTETGQSTERSSSTGITRHSDSGPLPSIHVPLGTGLSGAVAWEPSIQGSPHLFITGIPGQGKSWTVLRVLQQLGRQGVPALVFDYHGQLARDLNVSGRSDGPLVVDAVDGLPFSPFEATRDASIDGWNANAIAVSEIFAYVCDLGPVQRDNLFVAIRDSYIARGFDRPETDGPAEIPSLDAVRLAIELAERQGKTRNLISRLRALLQLDVFRPPADGVTPFADLIQRGMIVDFHRLPSETIQLAAGAFLLRKVYRDMFRWEPADRLRLAIVLDEAHRLAKDITLPKLLKEGRKFGIAVIAASQGLADFHDDVLGNTGTKIAFRANYPDSRKVAGYFTARKGVNQIHVVERLRVGQALVQTPDMPLASVTSMFPPS